jgi:hypothetical protein
VAVPKLIGVIEIKRNTPYTDNALVKSYHSYDGLIFTNLASTRKIISENKACGIFCSSQEYTSVNHSGKVDA